VGLEAYTDFLQSGQNTNWIKWQVKGNDFLELSDDCPYCTSPAKEKHEKIKQVSEEFDAKSIEHLTKVLSVVERLKIYFSDEARNNLFAITKNKIGLSKEDDSYLEMVKTQVDIFKGKLQSLQGITFFTFEDVDKVIEVINHLKINLGSLPFLNSEETKSIVDKLNSSLDTVLGMAGPLQGQVNQQKKAILNTIEARKEEINRFLKYAGYKYKVEIEGDAQQYKLKLLHHDMSGSVAGGSQHLSYGEKNAFALVLFMYECLANAPDLIVLDDPISSFDKNKKYALLDMLFTGKVSLKGKTVLMLTHDLEPIIDIVRTLSSRFSTPKPRAYFLKARGGVVSEVEITKYDIKTFAQICDENIATNDEVIIQLIYLRRHYETIDDKGKEYQLLSNLFHKKESPVDKSGESDVDMTATDITSASESICQRVEGFDYTSLLARLCDKSEMTKVYQQCDSDYEKLQVFRIINEDHDNSVIRKYINESFHIENEYICQLNPCKYEVVPEFIVEECDQFFES
jgi:wobble nucleotide-excising tRNase